jgi:mannosyltransferase
MSALADSDAPRRLALAPPRIDVVVLTLATAGVGFIRLGSRSIWGDEAFSISYAVQSLHGLAASVRRDPNMSLYYGGLWLWTRVFGDGVVSVRSMSVLFAALTVPVVYLLGDRLFGRRAGIFAALLLATNAYFLVYAQEARGYSLVTLLTALSMYFFVDALERERHAPLVGYVVSSALAFYAHFFAVYVTLAQVAVLVAARRRAVGARWVAAYAAIAALVAPIAYHSLALGENPISWIPRPGLHTLAVGLRSIGGNGTASAVAALVVLAIGLPFAARARPHRFSLALTAAWLLTPIVVSFAVSQRHPMFLPRYLVVSIPALALLLGAAVTAVRPQAGGLVLTAVVLLSSVTSLHHWYTRPGIQDWKGATAYLLARAEPGDGVAYEMSWALPAISYYERRAPIRPPLRWGARDNTFPAHPGRRMWLVLYEGRGQTAERLRSSLRSRGLRRVALRAFHGDFMLEAYARNGPG